MYGLSAARTRGSMVHLVRVETLEGRPGLSRESGDRAGEFISKSNQKTNIRSHYLLDESGRSWHRALACGQSGERQVSITVFT